MTALRAPFPWFGGKSRVAAEVWDAFGDVPNYVEPFTGSLAVLLGRAGKPRLETVNDRDCYLANFWRSLQASPEETAAFADWPVNEADLEARHRWLVAQSDFRERMMREPEYFDPKVAGWWAWGVCGWIGSGWCSSAPASGERGPEGPPEAPHLGNAGRGVNRQLPRLDNSGTGIHCGEHRSALVEYFASLAARLRGVRVACGDWSRVMGDSVTWRHGTTGIFLDPPYDDGEIDYAAGGRGVGSEVGAWCRENGNDPRLRIALCGYDGDHDLPGWRVHAWKAKGGFSSQRHGNPNGNPHRERIWFSPGCLRGALSEPLFNRGVA